MAKKRKQTETEKLYSKQLKRIKQFIRRAEKRGFIFKEDIIPQKPKKVTKASVRKLEKLTPEKLYKKSLYVEESTGEIEEAQKRRKEERKQSAKKAAKTRKERQKQRRGWSFKDAEKHREQLPSEGKEVFKNIIDDFVSRLQIDTSWVRKRRRPVALQETIRSQSVLLSLINQQIALFGEEEIGNRLQANSDKLSELISIVLWDSKAEAIQSATRLFMEILTGNTLTPSQLQDLDLESEYNEDFEQPE